MVQKVSGKRKLVHALHDKNLRGNKPFVQAGRVDGALQGNRNSGIEKNMYEINT